MRVRGSDGQYVLEDDGMYRWEVVPGGLEEGVAIGNAHGGLDVFGRLWGFRSSDGSRGQMLSAAGIEATRRIDTVSRDDRSMDDAPVAALVFGRRSSNGLFVDRDLDHEDVDVDLGLTLAPGERLGFLQFATLIKDDTDRSGDVTRALSLLAGFLAAPDLTGLSVAEIGTIGNFDIAPIPPVLASVPEPGTFALLGIGAFGIAFGRRRGDNSRSSAV